jgi:hypothetical protein
VVSIMRTYDIEAEYAGQRFEREATEGERDYARANYTRLQAIREEEKRHAAELKKIEQAYEYDVRRIERTA